MNRFMSLDEEEDRPKEDGDEELPGKNRKRCGLHRKCYRVML